ncbi:MULTISPECIES: dihydrofolate reductase family protein [Amycolatopsis]|uniref:Dihydrofolate reductase family protein n=1 Tax=Amycolatopsis tucumanensis TaxID=401106 RepID=A0ABP7I4N7_9PSEU|nr:dihydrofolate reductase family protein [Amycolatopsis tucumanensis]MCF6423024.1 dihydrofolate reductase family protein [Amycolatopsis tucumanensis]
MRSVTYSMSVSLDGYIVGPDGRFDWSAPTEEVFRLAIEEVRGVDAIWKAMPKVVFSTRLSAVEGNARLASGSPAEEIERLRAEPGDGDIAIGGATLAAEVAAAGLIDEYLVRVHPVLVGGGTPFFARRERRVDLELVENRTLSGKVAFLRYRVAR